jgi:cyclopropane fatty-acyl-phospholipid synthase-like methyltransferase
VDESLPFAAACERNKQPILDVLRIELASAGSVLEIGSGTGQHAVFFAASLPHVVWQASDRAENHASIRAWIDAHGTPNIRPPALLDVNGTWPDESFDAVFSANTAHIMSWPEVCTMMAGVGRVLADGGRFLLYGPFMFDGRHTSASNADFDRMLRARDPASGIRDASALDAEAAAAGMRRTADHPMPANNRILVWRKTG